MQSANRNRQKQKQRETNSSGKMRFFYILILLLMISSLFARVSGARPQGTGQASGGAAARVLVFHHEEGSLCEDLAITAAGNAALSNCGKGREQQYALNSTERSQLQSWVSTYGPLNYGPGNRTPTVDSTTQLYLNGHGKQQADDLETQQIIDFAEALAAKIVSEP